MLGDSSIYVIIAGTFIGFIALAFVLLFPVYRFMRRQERLADDWTPEALARRQRHSGNGAPAEDPADAPAPPTA